jgi:N-carbamoyl-L-amino-acid hydrolase
MIAFDGLWSELEPIGRNAATGGYRRFAYDSAELECREWFTAAAQARGLEVETDRNGNLWAWWLPTGAGAHERALVIGSHLDSVPDGGAFDGPLGVVSSFAAIDAARASGVEPSRPVAVAAFADEEGARFGIACAGSRLMTGQLHPDKARALVGRDGATMAEAMSAAGHDPRGLGPDEERLARIGAFVELHVEQGRALIDEGAPIGVATAIWPHGRYRFTFRGMANHAGTTLMQDRHDPMIAFARAAIGADSAARMSDSRATFGRVEVEPNGTNAIPSTIRAWLDARAMDQRTLDELLERVSAAAHEGSVAGGTEVDVEAESVTAVLEFDGALRTRVASAIADERGGPAVPMLPTGAGHDAGILAAAGVLTAMVFVRNPTGVSHSPHEHAERDDCHAGVEALTAVIRDMA